MGFQKSLAKLLLHQRWGSTSSPLSRVLSYRQPRLDREPGLRRCSIQHENQPSGVRTWAGDDWLFMSWAQKARKSRTLSKKGSGRAPFCKLIFFRKFRALRTGSTLFSLYRALLYKMSRSVYFYRSERCFVYWPWLPIIWCREARIDWCRWCR